VANYLCKKFSLRLTV